MIKGFFDSILDFLGLRQRVSNKRFESAHLREAQIGKRERREPKLKEAVEKRVIPPLVPTITPKGQARVFVKKEFAKTKIFAKKPIAARKLSAKALQFEIGQILKEAQAFKKRLKLGKKKLPTKGGELKVL